MTMLRNTQAEQQWGAIPVTDCGLDGSGNLQPAALNQDLTLLPSATRTTTTNSADQSNTNGCGVVVYVNISSASGTGGLTVVIQGKDPASGNYVVILTASAALTTTGAYYYEIYPGITTGGRTSASTMLPTTWRVQVQHGDSSNYTYSVGASVIL